MQPDSLFHPHPGGPSLPGPEQNVLLLCLVVLRRWWLVAGPLGLVLGGGAAAAVYLLVKPQYEAEAVIRVIESQPYIAFPTQESRAVDELTKFVKTQIEIIRSRYVLNAVVSQPEIAGLPEFAGIPDLAAELGTKIRMTSVGGSELFRLAFKGPDPKHAAQVVNAVTDAYFRLRDADEANRSERVIELLEKESAGREEAVRLLRDNVRALAEQTTGEDPFAPPSGPDHAALHPLAELQNRLTSAGVERLVLQAQITALEEWLARQPVASLASGRESAVEQDAEIQRLKARLAADQVKLRQIEEAAVQGRNDPAYARVQADLAQAEQTLAELRGVLQERSRQERGPAEPGSSASEAGGPRAAELNTAEPSKVATDLFEKKLRLKGLEVLERELKTRYDEQLASLKQVSGSNVDLEFRRDELKRAQDVHDRIKSRIIALRTERGAPGRVERFLAATPPTEPLNEPFKMMGLAFLGGCWAPFALLLLWEWRTRRISDTDQLQRQTRLTVLGEIASLPSPARSGRAASGRSARELRLFQESVDSLRTSLVLSEQQPQPLRVLVVTSATSREGKTSVAAQLAISLTQASGERTLLIDADLRDPDLHELFETALEPGLAQVLAREESLSTAVVPTQQPHLDLLPAGKLRCSPHQLFGSGDLRALLDEARTRYRYVIVDTPPILPAAEALVLAKAGDATIVCVMRDVSRVTQVHAAFARLAAAGVRPLGAVFNNVPLQRYASTYGDYGYRQEV